VFWAGPGEIHNTTTQHSGSITLQLWIVIDICTVDRANLRAQACAELDLLRELAQPRCMALHLNQGGSSRDPLWSREAQLERWNVGEETKASLLSLYWWSNGIIPYCCTSNCACTQIVGTDMTNLVVLLFARPAATCG
jgi:hypothetical protein